MKYIELLKEGERIQETYLCKTKQTAKTKAGRTYYSLVLQDRTGTVDAKIWDLGSGIDHFEALNYIRIDADVTCFQNTLQLNIKRLRVADEGEYVEEDYLPVSKRDPKQMYQELVEFVESIQFSPLKKLAQDFFVKDSEFIKGFAEHSAAKTIHHGFVGGLMEHTLAVVRLCDFLAASYPAINRDLLLSAALYHDIGKTKELSRFPENDYTDDGQLLGHIVIGVEMITEKIKSIPEFPERTASELKHCILAHHGEFEYGSPKKPALIEAIALAYADNTDSKLEIMTELLQTNKDREGWFGFNRLLDSNIRKTTEL